MTGTRRIVFVKRDCPTCQLVIPVLLELRDQGGVDIICQDTNSFSPALSTVEHDSTLKRSFDFDIEIVPTLVVLGAGEQELARTFGWDKSEWRRLTGIPNLAESLPSSRPGCGSRNKEPGVEEVLTARFHQLEIESRAIHVDEFDDEMEQTFARGWTDGLPVTPPTAPRILRMLNATPRSPAEVIGKVPPNLTPLTVEKAAINAVMAGCKPEYFPVVLAAVEAALEPMFTLHGLTCTTCFSSPVIIVNGPIVKRIGMNCGINALGQGNRANATIGRALNLIVRNVGGGKPGEIDRATLGGPGKFTFCFAEDESDPAWQPLATARGMAPGTDAVTLFQGDGIQGFTDQRSRTPQALTRSLAMSLCAVGHPKLALWCNAVLVLAPEHYAIFQAAGWDRDRITNELHQALLRPGRDLVRGAQGIDEGIDPNLTDELVPKFFDDGLLLVRAGGPAGLFSAILAGWTGGRFQNESIPITREIKL